MAFGEYAGKAGMVNTFRGLGERFLAMGYSTPFLSMGSTFMYPNYQEACNAVGRIGQAVKQYGIPKEFAPMCFGFTGALY